MKNFAGKEDTAFTVQYDFVGPKRFNLRYRDKDGQEKEPIVIHRSSIGCIERTMAFLIEHYVGAFPVWLSPVQAVIIPISDRHAEYARKIEAELKAAGIRVQLDDSAERMNQRIREAQLNKIPYMVVVGDKEAESGTVSVRLRTGEQLAAQSVTELKGRIQEIVSRKAIEL